MGVDNTAEEYEKEDEVEDVIFDRADTHLIGGGVKVKVEKSGKRVKKINEKSGRDGCPVVDVEIEAAKMYVEFESILPPGKIKKALKTAEKTLKKQVVELPENVLKF